MLSVNTNSGAMIALQYLNKTESDLQATQTHINTGLKVATAKDNGATFAIAQNMRGNVSGYQAASDASLDTASRNALNADFTALRDQISAIVQNANFNGTNLVDGSVSGINALASADGSRRITVSAVTLSLSGSVVTVTTTATISTQANASAMISIVNASIQNVNSALARLASGEKKFT